MGQLNNKEISETLLDGISYLRISRRIYLRHIKGSD